MQRALALVLALTALAGCPQDPVVVGFKMSDFFPIDNDRLWKFSNKDQQLDYHIVGTMDASDIRQAENGDNYVVLHYEKVCIEGVEECGAGFLYDLYMSSDFYGIAIQGYETPETGQVFFDNRLILAEDRMGRGETAESEGVDGHNFTSNFYDIEKDGSLGIDGEPIAEELGCDQQVGVEWECVHFVVESDPPGHWLAGDWWGSAGYNLVAWKRTNDEGKWRTIDADATIPDDGGDTDTQ